MAIRATFDNVDNMKGWVPLQTHPVYLMRSGVPRGRSPLGGEFTQKGVESYHDLNIDEHEIGGIRGP